MPDQSREFDAVLRGALHNADAVWTPVCPSPEMLLSWVEQGDGHPEAERLLQHVIGCGYCRREWSLLEELRALNREHALAAVGLTAAALPGRAASWVQDLLTEGFVPPIPALRASLARLWEYSGALTPSAVMRDVNAPVVTGPAGTAVRSAPVVLRWSEARPARHEVTLQKQGAKKRRETIWRNVAADPGRLTLPADAGLEAGGAYVWQVTARIGSQEYPSAPAAFLVLSDRTRRSLETLEATAQDSPVVRISLLEAHGLYDEALDLADAFLKEKPGDPMAQTIRTRLRERLPQQGIG